MGAAHQQHARNLVVMLTAGAAIADLIVMAKTFDIRATHLQQLAVPLEEQAAQRNLINALKR